MPKKAVWQGIFVFFLDILIAMVFDAGSARAEGSAARFQGIVTSLTGQPLTGASVILVAWPGGKEPIARVSTGEDGRFTIEGPAGARVEVVASMEGYCAYRITDVILGVGDQPQAAIALQRGVRVDGAVRAAQGSPVGGATVRVDLFRLRPSGLRKGSESEGSLSSGRAEVKTSEDGSFSLGVLPVADGYLLEVRHPGYPPHDLRLDLTGRASPAQIAIKLPAPAEIRGLVVGKDGSPVAGAMTRAIDLSRSAPTEEEPREASTSDEGVFRVGPLAPGRYRLEIRPPEGLREILGPIDVAAGASVDVGRIVVRPGVAIDGTVVDRRGDPVAGATVKAFRQLQNGRSLERVTRTGEDGRFRAAGLAEGFYTVRVEPKEPHLSQETEDIEAPATGISLEVGTEAVITGTVVDRNGAPLAKLRVWASASNPRSRYDNMGRAEIVDRESGAFRIRGLREGEVIVSARADRRSPVHSEPMYVEAGGSYGPLNLVLEPGHTIEGRVFDRTTGAGIGGAAVSLAADGDVGAITSRDGRFSLEGLRPGQASLSVEHPSYAPTQVNAVISPDEARLLDIPLEPGAELIVSVRTAQGAPA
ncbi:MAG: carboxypeptidase regulatory-like domain-containing protein, partial [Phyllobacteriaceae bacterium]|nr:carboxypeptidase regulatory-like domain-containing protein [Phyllobacteriaceae bacterium]